MTAANRDSASFWSEIIPEDWQEPSLRYVASIRNGSDYKEFEVEHGGYPVIGSGGEFARSSKFVHDGESVLLGRKGTVDKPLYINDRFWTVDTMFYTNVGQRILAKFLYYFATTIPFGFFQTNTAVPSMTQGDLGSIKVPLPNLEMQRMIVEFLDRETARIDDLIVKQERLIGLLAEKRQAVITQAVTKGLDTDAPTKPSGIPWIGEIPVNWMVSRLKNVSQIRYGLGQPPREVEGGVPVIRATNVRSGRVSEQNLMFADPEDVPEGRDAYLRLGEIIVVRSGVNTADSTVIHKKYVGCLAGYDMVVRPTASDPEFTAWALLSDYIRANQLVLASSRAAQPHLNVAELGEAKIVLPPPEEQAAVASNLNKRTKEIDALILKCNIGISLLRERRSALISAAVTGKIDVREGVV